jgi:hypothetical protein
MRPKAGQMVIALATNCSIYPVAVVGQPPRSESIGYLPGSSPHCGKKELVFRIDVVKCAAMQGTVG